MKKTVDSIFEFFLVEKDRVNPIVTLQLSPYHSNNMKQRKVCPHMEAFFDYSAFFPLIPFRIKMDCNLNEYVIATSKIIKVSDKFNLNLT